MKSTNALRPTIAAFLLMMAMALTTSALSFFVSIVCDDLGIGRGSFTLYYSLMTAAGAVCLTFIGQHINKKGVRGLILVSSIWVCCGFWLFSCASELWMFYAAAMFIGVFGTSCVSLCANVIVQQNCTGSSASGVLGLVMAGSGVGGMIFSLIIPKFLENFHWRWGYRFIGICWLVLVMGSFLLLGKQKNQGPAVGQRKTPVDGMTRAEALKSPKLYLMMGAACIITACCGIQQQLPAILSEMQFDSDTCSVMMSVMTAAIAVGKIVQGMLYGHLGHKKGGYIMLGVFAVSFLLLRSPATVYPALIALAFGMGTTTTLLPTVARFTFGAREYAAIWSIISTASSVGAFIATPAWGMVYDATGSYDLAMMVSPVLLVIGAALLTACYRLEQKETTKRGA